MSRAWPLSLQWQGQHKALCLLLTTDLSAQVQVGGSLPLPEGVPQPACLFRACEDAAVMLQKTAMNLVWFGLFPSRYRICNHPAEIADSVHEPD